MFDENLIFIIPTFNCQLNILHFTLFHQFYTSFTNKSNIKLGWITSSYTTYVSIHILIKISCVRIICITELLWIQDAFGLNGKDEKSNSLAMTNCATKNMFRINEKSYNFMIIIIRHMSHSIHYSHTCDSCEGFIHSKQLKNLIQSIIQFFWLYEFMEIYNELQDVTYIFKSNYFWLIREIPLILHYINDF